MSYEDIIIIIIEPGKRGGQPCIRGFRITVHDVLSYLASGMTEQNFSRTFPISRTKTFLRASRTLRIESGKPGFRTGEEQSTLLLR